MYLSAFILVLPLGIPELPQLGMFLSELKPIPLLALAYAAGFSSIVGGFLMPVALKRIKPTNVSMYMSVQPLTASIAAIILAQDIFSWDKPVALILICIGIYLVTQKAASPNELS